MTAFNSICAFSKDASLFAFQPASQKNIINVYPLDQSDGYKPKSTLVKPIDYEKDDLSLEDIEGVAWISDNVDTGVKRKNDGVEINGNKSTNLSVFVNCFSQGKIVFYEEGSIVNIIKNKHDIIGLKPHGKTIWILDSDKTVKNFAYNQTKPLKTFHLIDGKNDDIFLFDILEAADGKILLAVVTEKEVFVLDPSKRRPATVEKFDVFGCVGIKIMGNKYVIADLNSIKVFENGSVVREWPFESEKLEAWGSDKIIATAVNGSLSVFDLQQGLCISNIVVNDAEIIDSAVLNDETLLVAWLNVNEPNFSIVANDALEPQLIISNGKNAEADIPKSPIAEEEDSIEDVPAKASKKEKKDILESLTNAFNENKDIDQIVDIIESDKWNEDMIKNFVANKITKQNSIAIYESLSQHVAKNPWNDNHNCSLFLKWILILFNVHVSKKVSPTVNKTNKNLKHSLSSTSSTLPLLLSIQGKVEMLVAQAELRKEMQELSLDPSAADIEQNEDPVLAEEEDDNEENIQYVNGEENDELED
ncbi:hypothetical protein ACO0QE_000368 [Hanseniaspora vineae]